MDNTNYVNILLDRIIYQERQIQALENMLQEQIDATEEEDENEAINEEIVKTPAQEPREMEELPEPPLPPFEIERK